MMLKLQHSRASFAACSVLSITTSTSAIDAAFAPQYTFNGGGGGGTLEVQGLTGRLTLPIKFQGLIQHSQTQMLLLGGTASDSICYTLFNPNSTLENSVILKTDTHTGTNIGEITLDRRVVDIALTNGGLYGVQEPTAAPKTLEIVSISETGATQSIRQQPVPVNIPNWRLSGDQNGSQLLAMPNRSDTSIPQTYIIDARTSVSTLVPFPVIRGASIYDTVLSRSADTVTILQSGTQTLSSFPGGVNQGVRSTSQKYRNYSFGISDEFAFNYSPDMAALAEMQNTVTTDPIRDHLIRVPRVFKMDADISIRNLVAPDGTVLSNVQGSNLIAFEGPSPASFSYTPAPPGDFSLRSLGAAHAELDLATASRGVYFFSSPLTITADYSYESVTDHNRTVTVPSSTVLGFAYDPVSSNLVGNGDASLSSAGWLARRGSLWLPAVNASPSDHMFILTPYASYPDGIRQILQLPTPDGDMEFSFTYQMPGSITTNADVNVTLNGLVIADVQVTAHDLVTYRCIVSDPALRNLIDAEFIMRVTTTDAVNEVRLGSISLTAVPEPVSVVSACGAAAVLMIRRKRTILGAIARGK